jgi:hypothetical protein
VGDVVDDEPGLGALASTEDVGAPLLGYQRGMLE